MISHKDEQLAELTKMISHKDEQLAELTNSKSWRYTKIFRFLLHKLLVNTLPMRQKYSRYLVRWRYVFHKLLPLIFMVVITSPVRFFRSLYLGRFGEVRHDFSDGEFPFSTHCAVIYLARGKTPEEIHSIKRFIESYVKYSPGLKHKLYIVLKGFENENTLTRVLSLVEQVPHEIIHLDDREFDIGAYISASKIVTEEKILFLNTHSEILCSGWLQKIAKQLDKVNVGLVGCTSSFESLNVINPIIPKFPNPHIRTNAFMTYKGLFNEITEGERIVQKWDALYFESGLNSLTNRIRLKGYKCLLVGANGVGYLPPTWSSSQTFRLISQRNLIIGDNQTRIYGELSIFRKLLWTFGAWGNE